MPATSFASPTKYSVRAWMQQRQRERSPLPELAQIRRELHARPAGMEGGGQPVDGAPVPAGDAARTARG